VPHALVVGPPPGHRRGHGPRCDQQGGGDRASGRSAERQHDGAGGADRPGDAATHLDDRHEQRVGPVATPPHHGRRRQGLGEEHRHQPGAGTVAGEGERRQAELHRHRRRQPGHGRARHRGEGGGEDGQDGERRAPDEERVAVGQQPHPDGVGVGQPEHDGDGGERLGGGVEGAAPHRGRGDGERRGDAD
jgi:hypothetical protein